MKTNRPSKIIVAGLFAAALLFTQLTAQAVIVGPYTADANTLHLWHMDASVVPVPDAVVTGGTNLVKLSNGATLGTNSYSGFGTALNTIDGGQDGVLATNKDAYLTASSAGTPTIVAITVADPTTGAFTYEALVWIGFDPAKNFGATGSGGNGRSAVCQIMTGEGSANANRLFQLRIAPIGTVSGNTTVRLEFANVHLGVGNQAISMAIPTTGDDAIVSNNWYHVAVAYNGNENTADNITFYWTLLDPSRTNANAIGTSSMQFDLPVAPTCLAFGALAARAPIVGNFLGFIDEARISNIARGSNEMMFAATLPGLAITTQPADQTVAVGQSASFSVTASGASLFYQWRQSGTNVPGATQAIYSIASAQFTNAGPYAVVITNDSGGAVTSSVATLTVRTALNLTWLGLAGSDWNTNDVDWVTDTSVNVAYTPGDNVTFDNSGSGAPSVNLTGPLTPSAVVVNAASDYTLSTSVGGGIVGVSRLTKSGAGTLVLDTDNSYNGPTVIQGGIVQLGAGGSRGSLGTGPVTNNTAIVLNRTGSVSFNNTLAGTGSLTSMLAAAISITGANTLSGPIVLNAGSLSLAGPLAAGNSTTFVLNAPTAVTGSGTALSLSGGVTLGSGVTLSMLGTVDVPSDFRCNLTTGNNGLTNILNGPIVLGGGGAVQFITGANSELDINGSVSSPDFTGKLILRGTGVGHIYGTINLPSANHISTTDGGTWVLHSTGNSWTNSNFGGGTLRLAVNNALPPGVILSLEGTLDLGGFNQQIGGLTNFNGVGTITNSSTTSDSTLTLATADSWTFGGVIKDAAAGGTGKVGLTLAGGTLTLTNVSTFTGDATISSGTLALSGAGSLNSTAGTISIAAGATFDVSGVTSPPYHVRTGKTLRGGGVSGGATINGALNENGGGFLTLIYVSGTPAINVTGGELTLNGCATTVTVSGSALGVGSYKLISAGAGGSVAGTLPSSVTVGGSGLGANLTASLRVTSGELWLDVAAPRPVITSFSYNGTSLILSGSNGIAGNTYYVLAATNVAAPLTNWQRVFTNQFGANGVFSVTNAISPAIPARFYLLQLP